MIAVRKEIYFNRIWDTAGKQLTTYVEFLRFQNMSPCKLIVYKNTSCLSSLNKHELSPRH